jgi:hypothetical protein
VARDVGDARGKSIIPDRHTVIGQRPGANVEETCAGEEKGRRGDLGRGRHEMSKASGRVAYNIRLHRLQIMLRMYIDSEYSTGLVFRARATQDCSLGMVKTTSSVCCESKREVAL